MTEPDIEVEDARALEPLFSPSDAELATPKSSVTETDREDLHAAPRPVIEAAWPQVPLAETSLVTTFDFLRKDFKDGCGAPCTVLAHLSRRGHTFQAT